MLFSHTPRFHLSPPTPAPKEEIYVSLLEYLQLKSLHPATNLQPHCSWCSVSVKVRIIHWQRILNLRHNLRILTSISTIK